MPEWDIRDVLPDYDPALDWLGLSVGDGTIPIPLKSIRTGDVITSSGGGQWVVRYADENTLVTRLS